MKESLKKQATVFKSCPNCRFEWRSREHFLDDPKVKMIGYQVNFQKLELGYFLFNHTDCKTTIALEVNKFQDLSDGPIYKERKTGTDSCPTYCLNKHELEPCPEKCECAYVRDVMQIVRNWEKKSA